MHGRLLTALVLAGTLGGVAPAIAAVAVGPAPLQEPDTGACAARCTLVGDAPAIMDGVVVRWRIRSASAASLRLRAIQHLSAGQYVPLASSAYEPVPAGTQASFEARVPIAQGALLAVEGASVPDVAVTGTGTLTSFDDPGGAFTGGTAQAASATASAALQIAADVEPDGDGDDYGDDTQDACPGDAVDHATPCTATQTFGSPLALFPDPNGLSGSGHPMDLMQLTAPGTLLPAPIDGILTRWRLRASSTAHQEILEVLRPAGAGAYRVTAATASVTPQADAAVTDVPAQIAVHAGDRLALRSDGDQQAVAALPGTEVGLLPNPAPDVGDTVTPSTADGPYAFRLLLAADVEPDVNANGLGDVSQEPHADLAVTGAAPAEVENQTPFVQTYTVRNLGPDPSPGGTLAGLGTTLLVGSGCPAAGSQPSTCTLAPLAVGSSQTFQVGFIEPAIFPPLHGTFASSVRVTGQLLDPISDNDAAALSTVRGAYKGQLGPPIIPQAKPCGNVRNGGRDDDVLNGTAFGDRISGAAGADLIKGGSGDDCLSGGAGPDVVDGQAGDDQVGGGLGNDTVIGGAGVDRLTGGLGKDRLDGGAGNDTISPGPGRDRVTGGAGDDTISARDSARDVIDCGPGSDTVRADRKDVLRHCEKVSRR